MNKIFLGLILTGLMTLIACQKNFSPLENVETYLPFPPVDIDTTSHDFVWEIDTLDFPGVYQILPKAIWGSDTNDVWMVAHSDDWHARIWHWNGETWKAYTESGLGTSPTDMIGFAKNDIWFCSIRTGDHPIIKTIQHWDGQKWNIVKHNIETHILSMWGSSSQNLYFGLIDGRIMHYNGTNFNTINTNTSGQIVDITGDNHNNIYAIGVMSDTNNISRHHWIFKIKDKLLRVLNYYEDRADNEHLPLPNYEINIIGNYLFGVNGKSVYYHKSENIWEPIFNPDTKGIWQINGISINNIFISGYFGKCIYHFNGVKWNDFKELDDINFFGTAIQPFKDHVFIAGYANNKAYVIRGRRWSP